MKILRILAYISLGIVLILGIAVYSCAKGVSNIMKQVSEPLPGQTYTIRNGRVEIRTNLVPQMGIILNDVQACSNEEKKRLGSSNHTDIGEESLCINGFCTIKLHFPKTIPSTVSVFIKDNKTAICKKKILDTKSVVKTIGYKSTIGISKDIEAYLPVKGKDQKGFKKAPGSQFNSSLSFKFNEDQKTYLSYGKKVPSDVFIYNGHEVRINYND